MLDFMEFLQRSFSEASQWNRDNSYSALTDTAKALLDFSTPERLRVHLSSLSTPQFATSYTLGTVGLIDGSISYLFSTLPLDNTPSQSNRIPLRLLVPGYRQIYAPVVPIEDTSWQNAPTGENEEHNEEGRSKRQKPTLLHATLHLPPPTTLNALFLRRLSPTTQLSLALCSSQAPSPYKSVPQASILAQVSHDTGKYNTDFIFSTDNALIGLRGLWNFGADPRKGDTNPVIKTLASNSQSVSLVSAGGEFYYSPVSSVVGLSTGLRFATLPNPNGTSPASSPLSTSGPATSRGFQPPYAISTFPYTLTLTLTPLTGSLSTTYSLQASPNLAFSSRFGFNVYSWESEMVAGCELWRQTSRSRVSQAASSDNLDWARKKMGLLSEATSLTHETTTEPPSASDASPSSTAEDTDTSESVIKVRVDQSWNVRLLWEGRVKDLLVSAGVGLGPSRQSSVYSSASSMGSTGGEGIESRSLYGWKGVGVSVSYSS